MLIRGLVMLISLPCLGRMQSGWHWQLYTYTVSRCLEGDN